MARLGLQLQRTSLAWNRTALASLALLGAVVKIAADDATAYNVVCAALVTTHSMLVVACALARDHARAATSTARMLIIVHVSTVVTGIAAAVSVAACW